MLLLIYCFMYLPMFCAGLCFDMHYFMSSLILQSRELVALLLLSFGCLVTVNML